MKLPLHIKNQEFDFDFQEYRKKYSWVEDMFNTEQDSIHHSEGNVGIHTEMVMKSMTSLEDFKILNGENKETLFLSALFHDVEKRSTTKIEDGRIVSPGHAKKGEKTTRGILYREFEIPFVQREQICKLVRHHGLPLWIFDKQNPDKSLIETSLLSNTHFLYLIAKADIMGRECEDKEELFYRIDLFKEYALQLDVYNKKKNFITEHAKAIFFEKENSFIDYEPFDDTICEVTMMCAIPGSGKTHFIEKNYSLPIVSLDEIRRENKIKPEDKYATGYVIQLAKEKAKSFLRKKQSFVWDATNFTKQIREQLIGLFREYNARVKIIYLEVPYKTLQEQNKNRDYPVPEVVLERFIDHLEMPSHSEAHKVEYYYLAQKQNL